MGFQNSGPEKSLSIQSLVTGDSLEDKNVESSTDNGGLACGISEETKTLVENRCEESVASGQLEQKNRQ